MKNSFRRFQAPQRPKCKGGGESRILLKNIENISPSMSLYMFILRFFTFFKFVMIFQLFCMLVDKDG